jgi:hypothetical protein
VIGDSDEKRTTEQKSAISFNGFFFPIANLSFLSDDTPQIALCLFVRPSALMRLA